MLLDRSNWARHRPWFWLALLTTFAAGAWYAVEAITSPRWPGGSSLPGFVGGIVGGLICLFEFALWLRKKIRAVKIGTAQAWLRAHIWLGLLTIPLLLIHSGFRFGGPLAAILLVLLFVVVGSGVWGWVLQNYLPAQMLEEIPDETIAHHRDALGAQMEDDARTMVARLCNPAPEGKQAKKEKEEEEPSVVVAAGRTALAVPAGVSGCQPLAAFFENALSPYYLRGAAGNAALAHQGRSRLLFEKLREEAPPEAHGVVDTLETYCQRRRQWDRQARIHFWLHNWLWVHFPLSVGLIVLMFVHVFVALKFY